MSTTLMAGHSLSLRFGDIHAVREASFDIKSGEFVSVTGPSGSGKSSLLALLGLLALPTGGRYAVSGMDLSAASELIRARTRSRVFGFVFQSFNLFGSRSAVENVAAGLLYMGVPTRRRMTLAANALERVGLEHRILAKANTLSGGEQQRVAIARALVGRKRAILCDEPTGNLDTTTSRIVLEALNDLHSDGLTIVVATHNHEIATRADTAYEMTDGVLKRRKEQLGTPTLGLPG